MRWRKRIEERITLLRGDVNDLSFCRVCWAAVWMPHKRLHQQWHEVRGDVGEVEIKNPAGTAIALNQWDRLDGTV